MVILSLVISTSFISASKSEIRVLHGARVEMRLYIFCSTYRRKIQCNFYKLTEFRKEKASKLSQERTISLVLQLKIDSSQTRLESLVKCTRKESQMSREMNSLVGQKVGCDHSTSVRPFNVVHL